MCIFLWTKPLYDRMGPPRGKCEDRLGTGPPRAGTEVIYVGRHQDYSADSGVDSASAGNPPDMNTLISVESKDCEDRGGRARLGGKELQG